MGRRRCVRVVLPEAADAMLDRSTGLRSQLKFRSRGCEDACFACGTDRADARLRESDSGGHKGAPRSLSASTPEPLPPGKGPLSRIRARTRQAVRLTALPTMGCVAKRGISAPGPTGGAEIELDAPPSSLSVHGPSSAFVATTNVQAHCMTTLHTVVAKVPGIIIPVQKSLPRLPRVVHEPQPGDIGRRGAAK